MVATPTKTTTKSPYELVREVFEARGQEIKVRETNKSYDGSKTNRITEISTTNCPGPNHKNNDANASLGFWEVIDNDGKATVCFKCFCGCTRADILKALRISTRLVPGAPTQIAPKRPVITLIDIARYTGIDWRFLFNLGWTEATATFHNKARPYREQGIIIPYRTRDGKEYETSKIRIRLEKGHDKDNRFLYTESDEPPIAYGLDQLHEAEEAGYLVIPEGETDYATLRYHDIPALALPGANMVRSTLRVEDVKDIPIIYVIQEKTDEAGKNFPYEVKLHLEKSGYTGKILRVPLRNLTGAKDPNDLHKKIYIEIKGKLDAYVTGQDHKELKGRFKEKFDRCLEQAKPMEVDTGRGGQPAPDPIINKDIEQAIANKDARALLKSVPILATLSRADYASLKLDIREAFRGIINLNDLDAAVNEVRKNSQTKDTKPDLDMVATVFHDRYSDTWAYDKYRQTWKQWTGTHWHEELDEKVSKTELDPIFTEILHEFEFEVNSVGTLECVYRCAKNKCSRTFSPREGIVNFKNGTLNIETMSLEPHSKDDDLDHCLPYAYAPGPHPTVSQYLASMYQFELVAGEGYQPDPYAAQAFAAHIGLALIRDTRLQYTLFMKGRPNGGKSTSLDFANYMTGVIDRPGISKYADGSFLFSDDLEGKRVRYKWATQRLVCIDEMPTDALRQEGIYKAMAAHGGVGMRGMNKDDKDENQWHPKMLIACNEAPAFKDTTGAIKRRNIYLLSPHEIDEKDRDLDLPEKLAAEAGTFAQTCILLALEVRKRGYYPQSTAMRRFARQVSSSGNPLMQFVEDCCKTGNDADGKPYIAGTTSLHKVYKTYCFECGYKPLALNSFVTALLDMKYGIKKDPIPRRDPNSETKQQIRMLIGIALADADEIITLTTVENDDPISLELDITTNNYRHVTDCDGLVTDFSKACNTIRNGSTSQFSTSENAQNYRLTDFSENSIYTLPLTL